MHAIFLRKIDKKKKKKEDNMIKEKDRENDEKDR